MGILLDECVPKRLKREVPGHDVHTVPEMGWSGIKNGELLKRMIGDQFEALIPVGQNLRFQQNVLGMKIALLVLIAVSNRAADLFPLMPDANTALAAILPGQCVEIRLGTN
jgi:hypothetical protein